MSNVYIITASLLFAAFIIGYNIWIIISIYRYFNSVAYSTTNNMKCKNNSCYDDCIETYNTIPEQKDLIYCKDVSKFCAQIIIRIEYPEKYDEFYLNIFDNISYIKSNTNEPVFCIILLEPNTDIMWILFRGTYTFSEIIADIDYTQTKFYDNNMKVHRGFYTIYKNIKGEVLKKINEYKPSKIIMSGHSLGAAVSTMMNYDIYNMGINSVTYNFGSPKVGNSDFCEYMNKNCVIYSVINQADTVTMVPPPVSANFFNKNKPYYYNTTGKQILFEENWNSIKNNHRLPIYIKNI